jgi:hypothetical protein
MRVVSTCLRGAQSRAHCRSAHFVLKLVKFLARWTCLKPSPMDFHSPTVDIEFRMILDSISSNFQGGEDFGWLVFVKLHAAADPGSHLFKAWPRMKTI